MPDRAADALQPPEAPPIRPDGLQLAEAPSWQQAHWRTERIAWIGFLALVVAAAAGATGAGGALASRQIDLAGTVVDLPRIARWQAADALTMRHAPGGAQVLRLGPGFVEAFAIEAISPAPLREVGDRGGLRIEIAGEGAAATVLSIRPRHPGLLRYRVGSEAATREVWTLVLP